MNNKEITEFADGMTKRVRLGRTVLSPETMLTAANTILFLQAEVLRLKQEVNQAAGCCVYEEVS